MHEGYKDPDTSLNLPQVSEDGFFENERTETTFLFVDAENTPMAGAQPAGHDLPEGTWGVLNYRDGEGTWLDVPMVGDEIVIGRSEQAHASLAFDKRVSRVHCLIVKAGDAITLFDRGSENGTFVDDELAEERELQGGEVVRVGDTSLVFHRIGASAASQVMAAKDPASAVREFAVDLVDKAKAPSASALPNHRIIAPVIHARREVRSKAVIEAARILSGSRNVGPDGSADLTEIQATGLNRLMSRLMRARLPWTEVELSVLAECASVNAAVFPIQGIVSAIEAYRRDEPCTESLGASLQKLAQSLDATEDQTLAVQADRVRGLMAQTDDNSFPLAMTLWGRSIKESLEALDQGTQKAWFGLFEHTRNLKGNMQPSDDWMSGADALLGIIGKDTFASLLIASLERVDPGPSMDPQNRDVLQGLVRISGRVIGADAAPTLVAFAQACFERIPGYGPRSARLATAAVHALNDLEDPQREQAFKELESSVRLSLGRRTIRRVRKQG